jgi:hypothetical protein
MTIYELKTWPEYFQAVWDGEKTFEYRLNDRDFQVGDMLILREFKSGVYSGREMSVSVTYILKDFEYLPGLWIVMSIRRLT